LIRTRWPPEKEDLSIEIGTTRGGFTSRRFVIRGSSAIQTIGGGVILDSHPDKHRRFSSSVIADLRLLKDGTTEQALLQHIHHSGMVGTTLEDLLNRIEKPPRRSNRSSENGRKRGSPIY